MSAQREWFEKDYYKVLGVNETATAKEIKTAFRKLSRQFHPDTNSGDPGAEERFKEISAAYDVIGDETKRKEYDDARRLGPMAGGFGGPGATRSPPTTSATSVICSATCSTADAGAVAGASRVVRDRNVVPTSRPN